MNTQFNQQKPTLVNAIAWMNSRQWYRQSILGICLIRYRACNHYWHYLRTPRHSTKHIGGIRNHLCRKTFQHPSTSRKAIHQYCRL